MTKLLRATFIIAALFMVPFSAQAADDVDLLPAQPLAEASQPPAQPLAEASQPPAYPPFYGSFCSLATMDGVWGFVFNQNDVRSNCNYVSRLIASATGAPVVRSNSGYYQIQGWNQAVAQCGLIRSYFTERGAYALQRAYNYAKIIGGQSCIFEVYFDQ